MTVCISNDCNWFDCTRSNCAVYDCTRYNCTVADFVPVVAVRMGEKILGMNSSVLIVHLI